MIISFIFFLVYSLLIGLSCYIIFRYIRPTYSFQEKTVVIIIAIFILVCLASFTNNVLVAVKGDMIHKILSEYGGFFGSVIGGLITLYVLFKTIGTQQFPFLDVCFNDNEKNEMLTELELDNTTESQSFYKVYFRFSNMTSASILSLKYIKLDSKTRKMIKLNDILNNDIIWTFVGNVSPLGFKNSWTTISLKSNTYCEYLLTYKNVKGDNYKQKFTVSIMPFDLNRGRGTITMFEIEEPRRSKEIGGGKLFR